MFSRRLDTSSKSFSKSHGKASKSSSSFSRDSGVSKRRHEPRHRKPATVAPTQDSLMSRRPLLPVVLFLNALRGSYPESATKRISLADEEPEIFSSVLEYLYKGDYFPRLKHNKRRNSWELEATPDEGAGAVESTVYHRGVDGDLLKDTVIYCAAQRYGLEELKKLALRKQGLQSGIQCGIILASARYAYANTPDNDSKLRAHYLALIIRSRSTFKRSGTMQLEMYNGGTQLFFDLFVALCNHVDDISSAQSTPRSNRHIW